MKRNEPDPDLCFTGEPISADEARQKWPIRYSSSAIKIESTDAVKFFDPLYVSKRELKARVHYNEAIVDGVVLKLGDDVYVQAGENKPNHIAKIIELFVGLDGEPYFRAQWFYRPENTVIQAVANYENEKLVQDKRVFLSNVEDDNSLNCIDSKVNIAKFPLKMMSENEERVISPSCDFFYDMTYELDHFTFSNADNDIHNVESDESTVSSENDSKCGASYNKELYLLDLYSGCGAMSTGLTIGASYSEMEEAMPKVWTCLHD
ncbi:unnamed protein product [Arabis nemorensis]|uniref:BAH domain-containing protein n=1 Tax=Arabis nemorensis TaxID=586526 RepID=A0A565BZK1_9BRAS|nr:unnamed protein product [Arabis nemorensis]